MAHLDNDRIPAELARVAERLRAERAVATPLEMDRMKLRVKRQAARRTQGGLVPRRTGALMKSRLALISIIVIGVLMSGGGASLAISGVSGQGGAAENQYTTPSSPTDPTNDQNLVAGQEHGSAPAGNQEGAAAPTEQIAVATESGGESLPFTGFLAITLMIGGIALVSTGAVMRRMSGQSNR
jgi:hypothetical protein